MINFVIFTFDLEQENIICCFLYMCIKMNTFLITFLLTFTQIKIPVIFTFHTKSYTSMLLYSSNQFQLIYHCFSVALCKFCGWSYFIIIIKLYGHAMLYIVCRITIHCYYKGMQYSLKLSVVGCYVIYTRCRLMHRVKG